MKKPASVITAFNSYTLGNLLGEGGSGYVYAAVDSSGKGVAIKLLNPQRATEDKRRRFKNEYLFCSRSDHANVIKVTDYGIHDGNVPFLVMPRYDNSIRKYSNDLEPIAKFNAFINVLNGVEAAHLKNVIHRDLKPENILCLKDMSRVVVADFGIARFDDDEYYTVVETKAADRMANFKYRAPEQMDRDGVVSPRTDIFSLGLILNELFTGKVPVGSGYKLISQSAQQYAYLDPIVDRMIDQDPDHRFASIDELKKEISKQGELQLSRQKLAELDNTVISVETPDDPLISDPIKIIDVDWNNGTATVTLNRAPNMSWSNVYRNMGTFQYSSMFHPNNITFSMNQATFSCESQQLQGFVNFVKGWLENTNKGYAKYEAKRLSREEASLQQKLAAEKQAEEERQATLKDLTF